MTVYLGLDGGGSGCRARAWDASGIVIGEGMAGPANIMTDLEEALSAILAAGAEALGGHDPRRVSACLGLAGASQPDKRDQLAGLLPYATCRIVPDWHIAAKGALGENDGIVAAIGTGSVYVAQRDGKLHAIGGRGLILGDEGGGAWIGRVLLSAALRAVDGLGSLTPLLDNVVGHMAGPEGIITFAAAARPADFAALAPMVTASDDAAAGTIMREARAHVLAAIERLQQGADLPVVCLGGLAHAFSDAICEFWTVIPGRGTALDGAHAVARPPE